MRKGAEPDDQATPRILFFFEFQLLANHGFTDVTEFDGTPWELPGRYLERSPITYVKQVKVPLHMIHSELDLRTPMEQEVALLRYPDEDHDLSRTGKPWHRVHRLESIVDWLDQHLKA